jgi:hypothetical protein
MPTFARGTLAHLPPRHVAYRDRRDAALTTDTETDTPTSTSSSVRYAPDPMTVRGIPAVGRNCPGHIAGTQPEARICR